MDASTLIDSSAGNTLKNITFAATTSASDAVNSSTATGSLSSDGKTLTITLAGADVFEGTYTITVTKDVRSKDGEALKDYSTTFSIVDKVAPVITKVASVTNTNVATSAEVTFSEPVSAAVVKINGVVHTPTGLGTTKLTVTGLALDVAKTHTVEILNATDAVGNVNPLQTKTFNVTKDAVAPVVTAKAAGDHQILLTFSKNMDVASITTTSVKVVKEDLVPITTYTVGQVGTNKTEFLVDITDALYANGSERTLTVQVNDNAKDELGNKATVTTLNVKLTKDTVAPTVESVTVIKDTQGNAEKLRIKFNEKIDAAPTDLSKVTAKNAVTGVTETVANILDASTLTLLADNQTVEVSVQSAALGKKVNLAFEKGFVVDTAQTANDSVAFSRVVDLSEATSAFKIAQTDLTTTTQNVVVIDYGRAVLGDFSSNAANNPANYTIAGHSLPANTDITINGTRDVVTINLPAEFIAKTDTNAVLTVNNVKDINGTIITPFVGYANVKDNITPVLEKVQWNADGTLTLSFTEDIDTGLTTTEAGVEIKLNSGTITLDPSDYTFTAGIGADAGKIVVEFNVTNDSTHGDYIDLDGDATYTADDDILVANIANVSVKTLANNGIQDAAGNDAKANVTITVAK